jgi:glucose dehydrogenase
MAPWALAPGSGFTPAPNIPAPNVGASIWSSFSYDSVLDRIYVGTGNTVQGDANPQPDVLYGSGVLALDATAGAFQGFYEPTAGQSYRPNDTDVDVCGSPVVFSHGGQRFVAIGSKSGCFFLFDASNMNLVQSRQLLPYIDDNPATPLTTFDDHPTYPDENKWGVFGTPAVDYGLGCVFVALGGYAGTDTVNVPFVRALHWDTLLDFWPTSPPPPGGVRKYIGVTPPVVYEHR